MWCRCPGPIHCARRESADEGCRSRPRIGACPARPPFSAGVILRRRSAMAKKTAVGGMDFGGDPRKLLALLGLMGTAGLLPPDIRRAVRVAGLAYAVWS